MITVANVIQFPMVGTSYDYSAPVSETRLIGDKYSETKLLSYFVRAAKDLTLIERGSNGTNLTTNSAVFTQTLYNVENGARFYQTVHANSTSQTYSSFKLHMITSVGNITVPQYAPDVVLNGRQSKILISDFNAGSQKIIYSTAEILTVSIIEEKPVIVLWVPTGESGEFYLEGDRYGNVAKCENCANIGFYSQPKGVITTFTQGQGSTVLTYGNGATVIILDRTAAYKQWQPVLTNDPHVPLDKTILVSGPYLVRTASIDGETLTIAGDYNGTTSLEIFAPSVKKITFNGKDVPFRTTSYGSVTGALSYSNQTISSVNATLPVLSQWKVADGLPERFAEYNDSGPAWVVADHNSTLNPSKPATYPVLYADEYGFHTGPHLWRGRFTGNATGAFINVIHGVYGGWSAWLNGDFIGSTYGDSTLTQTNLTLSFANATVKSGENVLFIIQDNMGHDETTGAINPRGISNATLFGGSFTSWKIAGNAGGEANIDPVRGPLSEGGFHAERLGWHLPGFDDSKWASSAPSVGLNTSGANFYRTIFPLDLPEGHDVSLAFGLSAPAGGLLRAQLYVNGYQFARFIPHVGNQVEFPVYPGILDYHGENTVGLSIWAQSEAGASVGVAMSVLGVHASSLDLGFNSTYLRPGWTEERLQYH